MSARQFANSSMIDHVSFDDDTNVLAISFRQTGKYLYYGVPRSTFDALCEASSTGSFFNEQIKGNFPCRRDPDRRRFGPNG